MKGYWHIPAISVVVAFLTIYFSTCLILFGFIGWILWMYVGKRLSIEVLFASLIFFFFFFNYIPSVTFSVMDYPSQQVERTGKVVSSIKKTPKKTELLLLDFQTKETILVQYFLENNHESLTNISLQRGATCRVKGKMQSPERSTNPGQFDYALYLAKQNITAEMTIASLDDCICSGSSSLSKIDSLRENMQRTLIETYEHITYAWMNGLIFGDDSLISEENIELFRRWNLSHLLAISGLHVGLIITILYFLLVKTGIVTKEKAQLLIMLFLPIYALIAGGEPSVLRASVMALLVMIFLKMKIKMGITDVISLVFILFVLLDKYIIYHVGFQLSFLVSFGLIISKRWLLLHPSFILTLLKISFISQMVILPVQFAYFMQFHPLSILLNVLIVPYFSFFVIPCLFLLLILAPIPFFREFVEALFLQSHSIVLRMINKLDEFMYFPWINGSLPNWFVFIYYGLLIGLMLYMEREKVKEAFSFGIALTVSIMCILIQPYLSSYGTLTMLDIGQGDSFLMELPFRKGVIFYDVGSTFSFEDMQPTEQVYKQVIKPALHSKGIQKIDAVFLSHEDIDHIGSIDFLVKEFEVDEIIVSEFYQVPVKQEQFWKEQGTIIRYVRHNEVISISGHPFKVLSPLRKTDSDNENSLVLYSEFGNMSWLFTGDIGKQTEKAIIQQYKGFEVDILRVGHHGSKTSTDSIFIEQIEPTYALISAGRKNRYGHPAPEVLDVLKKHQLQILRTDKDGAIIFRYQADSDKKGHFQKFIP